MVYDRDKSKDPVLSLQADLSRDILLHGRDERAAVKKSRNIDEFKAWIGSNFTNKKISDLIMKNYSQGAQMFVGQILTGSGSIDPMGGLGVYQPTEKIVNLYESQGAAYIKLNVEKYPVKDMNGTVGYIHGPVEALFKLEENGFALQYVSTNSALIRDMYLGKSISEDQILKQMNVDHLPERSILEIETTLKKQQKKLENWFIAKELTDQDTLGLESLRGSLRAIQQYKTGKMDIEDLQTAVSTYLQQATEAEKALTPQKMSLPQRIVSRLFSSPPTTKDILKKALKDIERVQKAVIKQENTGLRR